MLGLGIVGLPNVGKSTLFNAITRAGAVAANYPFTTVDKNIGVVPVPDQRLDVLARILAKKGSTPKKVPTTIEFVDIAGLVRGASGGEGLGNQFLGHIREVSAIVHVVRCFEDPNVVHVSGAVDPESDVDVINTELLLADINAVERRIDKLKRQVKGDSEAQSALAACEHLASELSDGVPARNVDVEIPDGLHLLTAKPVVYVLNVDDLPGAEKSDLVRRAGARAEAEGAEWLTISAQFECELAGLPEGEAAELLAELGLQEPGLNRLIKSGYETLGLITFLTGHDKEVRAWTVRRGTQAPQAAGEIHSDFERGFIRAEVVPFHLLAEAGSIAAARSRGWLRTEGRNYVVQDGDVIHFLFNV